MSETIARAVLAVLQTPEPRAKIMTARRVARDWRQGKLAHRFDAAMPDYPARPETPVLLSPGKMPRRRGGGAAGRISLLHALAHIEYVAIDLAFDLIGRFGAEFPPAFVTDWLKVAADEAMHFALLDRRLHQLGSHYGALPAHDGLWEAAYGTRHDVLARLAVVPMVLEARALDISPATIARFENQRDLVSAKILNRIYHDEIRHVWFGTHWFENACQAQNHAPQEMWKNLVKRYFHGVVKPPFNDSARAAAGLTQEYYAAVAHGKDMTLITTREGG